ncbi:MAG: hypothetical protein U0798_11985 [Gemmataceae bacterium]
MGNGRAGLQLRKRHDRALVGTGVGHVNKGQFEVAGFLRVIHPIAFVDRHSLLDLHRPGDGFAREHEDHAAVDEQNAAAVPGELEADEVSRQQVDEQQEADQFPGREVEVTGKCRFAIEEDGEKDLAELGEEIEPDFDKPGPEIIFDDFPDAIIDLREGAEEHETHAQGKQAHRELQRSEGLQNRSHQ